MVTPLLVKQRLVRIDVPILIGLVIVTWLLAFDGRIAGLEGLLLLAGAVAHTLLVVRDAPTEPPDVLAEHEVALVQAGGRSVLRLSAAGGLTLAGLAGLILGGRWMLSGATQLARDLGVDELIIGLTVVAVGTSLPEIAATVLAAMRREPDLAVGNAVGSGIYNLLAILGACALAAPDGLRFGASALWFDLPVLCIAALLCVPVFLWGGRITRQEGVLHLTFYLGYLAVLGWTAQGQSGLAAASPVLLPFLLAPVGLLAGVANRESRRLRAR